MDFYLCSSDPTLFFWKSRERAFAHLCVVLKSKWSWESSGWKPAGEHLKVSLSVFTIIHKQELRSENLLLEFFTKLPINVSPQTNFVEFESDFDFSFRLKPYKNVNFGSLENSKRNDLEQTRERMRIFRQYCQSSYESSPRVEIGTRSVQTPRFQAACCAIWTRMICES